MSDLLIQLFQELTGRKPAPRAPMLVISVVEAEQQVTSLLRTFKNPATQKVASADKNKTLKEQPGKQQPEPKSHMAHGRELNADEMKTEIERSEQLIQGIEGDSTLSKNERDRLVGKYRSHVTDLKKDLQGRQQAKPYVRRYSSTNDRDFSNRSGRGRGGRTRERGGYER